MINQSDERERVIELLTKLGKAYLEKGQYNEAIAKFNQLIRAGVENSFVYLNLSKAYILKEQYDDVAVDVFRKTLSFDPDNKVVNIILSQIYLDEQRDDDDAYIVYKKALQYNPQNTQELEKVLARIELKKGNIQDSRKLTERVVLQNPENVELVSEYVSASWKDHAYHDVRNLLRQVMDTNPNASIIQLYVRNILKLARHNDDLQLDGDDVAVCQDYLAGIDQFDSITEIASYFILKKYLDDFSSTEEESTDNSDDVSEYELFLTETSITNIWKKALRTDERNQGQFLFTNDVWGRIEAPSAEENGHLLTEHDVRKLNTLLLIHLDAAPGTVDDQVQAFWKLIQPDVDELHYKRRVSDGLLILFDDLKCALTKAKDILKRSYTFSPQTKITVVVQPFLSTDPEQFVVDLTDGFAAIQAILDDSDASEQRALFITSKTEELIHYEDEFRSHFWKTVSPPFYTTPLEIHQLVWENVLDRLRTGMIKKIKRMQIVDELHMNDTFSSFKAIDSFLDRLVILKILRPDILDGKKDEMLKRFFEQASIVGKLNHPNIAKIYDIDEAEGFHYVSREYVEGNEISTPLTIFNQVQWMEVIRRCISVGEAIRYAHEFGVMHGRIKPSNVFLTETKEIKITDFTIPDFSINLALNSNSNMAALAFLAPEQLQHQEITPQTDIYQLGVLLYSLVRQQNPFYHDQHNVLKQNILEMEPEHLSSLDDEIPEELDVILLKAMAKKPDKRYESMSDMLDDLQQLLKDRQS